MSHEQGRRLRGGDEGDMSPQYSDKGDDILYVPPQKKKFTEKSMI